MEATEQNTEYIATFDRGHNGIVDTKIVEERSLEQCELNKMSSSSNIAAKHLSKSASELSSPREMPEVRPSSAAPPENTHLSVYQKAHSFISQLKHRWGHGKRERKYRRKSPGRQDSTDYAADLSSDHSTPSTQSPAKHVFSARTDSPLSRSGLDNTHSSTPSGSPALKSKPTGAVAGLDLLPASLNNEVDRRREAALREHSFFQLKVHLRRGLRLTAMDKNGLSDPYVKFKVSGNLLYKSKTISRDLNPNWDEHFTVPIEDPFNPLQIKVFDYDWGMQDDFMGSALLDLTSLDLLRSTDLTLPLQDPSKKNEDSGEIMLTVTLIPIPQEDKDQFFPKNSKTNDAIRRIKSQIWSSVVTIVLVEAKNLLGCDPETTTTDSYVRFRLGNEKHKSRTVWRSSSPRWLEQFDLHLYDDSDQQLEITVWDKDHKSRDNCIARCHICLKNYTREVTHNLWQNFEEGSGMLHLLLTISGTTASETITDLTTYEENPAELEGIRERYDWRKTFQNLKDVGHLVVKVYRASGLAPADLGGKSDPFCVLELGNARLQTQTEYKTLTPNWNKIFTFNVKDINSYLEITVYDEDRDHKMEFLGKLSIPLLRIRNGEKRWFALKDKKLRARAKGNNPQILLEMDITWNAFRACIRTLNPKEEKYMQSEVKFKRQVFLKNVMRLKVFIILFYEFAKIFENCFEWESKIQSFAALSFWLILCYYFEPWMVPIGVLLIFLKQYIVKTLAGPTAIPWDETADSDEMDDDEDEAKDAMNEEKKTLKERLQAIQEVTQSVQNAIGKIASLLESVKNTFNFTVPYLSWIAIAMLLAATVVLYFIPMRYLLMLWGTNKFLRRILRPHSVPNNEVMDLLSRVPDDEMMLDYKDLKVLAGTNEPERRKDVKKKHKAS
ncbi:multiple C2 and transmembrane domain-containing protein isoform X3 [Harmonia axyridis]|uniref:multiple C2 and transmembrane domain-containing protein isoform X3 n=1 Tax=Harmonia axyridis TaxID=115357 RepID=UPI001E2794CC|nr:multiple C2 and transmembrane domain-containing protein isoform X3 [Harmonia axyridis]